MGQPPGFRLFRCKNCGATMQFDPRTLAVQCNFCGAQHAIDPEQAPPAARPELPDAIVPFRIDRAEFLSRAADWFTRGFFTKDDLPLKATAEGLNGLYLPFYAYRLEYEVHFEVDVGYHEIIRRKKGTQIRTRWRPHNGNVEGVVPYDDLTLLASAQVLGQHADYAKFLSRADFASGETKSFDPRFLLGFGCEPFDLGVDDLWDRVGQGKAVDIIRRRVVAMLPGDTYRNLHLGFVRAHRTTRRLYYPYWIETYSYRGKPYQVFVDGQNGRVSGSKPLNAWKVALLPFTVGVPVYAASVLGGQGDVLVEAERGGLSAAVVFPLLGLVIWFVLDFMKRRSIRQSVQAGRPHLPWISRNGPIGLALAAALCLVFLGISIKTHADAAGRYRPPEEASQPPVAAVAPTAPPPTPPPVAEQPEPPAPAELGLHSLTVTATVDPTRPDGQAWDRGGGLPDISARLVVDGVPLDSKPCRDSLGCRATFEHVPLRSDSAIVVKLFDRDGDSTDTISEVTWAWTAGHALAARAGSASVELAALAEPAGPSGVEAPAAVATAAEEFRPQPVAVAPVAAEARPPPAAAASTGSVGRGASSETGQGSGRVCCKYCSTGKPCGDTCIPRNRTCHRGRGCACAVGE